MVISVSPLSSFFSVKKTNGNRGCWRADKGDIWPAVLGDNVAAVQTAASTDSVARSVDRPSVCPEVALGSSQEGAPSSNC